MAKKYVYYFGEGKAEGEAKMKMELGGKGANLAEMTNLGIPVPPGFTISTTACKEYQKSGGFPDGMMDQAEDALKKVERAMDRSFGGSEKPLLFSVRSGAPISMPGMMDTVLNLGLTDSTIKAMIQETGNERFVYDSYRRLIHMFGDVVMGVHKDKFEHILSGLKKERGAEFDNDLTASDLHELIKRYKELYKSEVGEEFPQDPWDQLRAGIKAVFDSWDVPRARTYRRLNNISEDMGTAVNVQTMVFGNLNDNSATGVAFTRDPSSGKNFFYGEYLVNAQGEDVVAGIRTPQPINDFNRASDDQVTLESIMPDIYKDLHDIRDKLDSHYKDMQDIEFTIQDGRLFMLQTRTGKRSGLAHVVIAKDILDAGWINEKEALMRIPAEAMEEFLLPTFDEKDVASAKALNRALGKGLPAGKAASVGRVVFDAETAIEWAHKKGEKVILVRNETTPDDVGGMDAAQGILTALGGMTSHAALVARGMGKSCIVGAKGLSINYEKQLATVSGKSFKKGDWISLHGQMGEYYIGQLNPKDSEVMQVLTGEMPEADSDFYSYYEWAMEAADNYRSLGVRTNADTPNDSVRARLLGAEGIGLCRTEHMFFEEDRIPKVQRMILSNNEKSRREALEALLPLQQSDFEGIFEAMNGLPVTIRLLDPPLHEFLPHVNEDEKILNLSKDMGVSEEELRETIGSLHELNPMLGHRGCRLSITFPEIAEMQVAAIIGAACECRKRGIDANAEIMVPLICHANELNYLEPLARRVAEETIEAKGIEVHYLVGTMIEIPRAALTAADIARTAEFFSFGTNDLTQMAFGFSRDDIGSFLYDYLEKNILPKDPFQAIDQEGVGQLVEMACKNGRNTRPELKLGICGEHGGEPSSIDFCHRVGLDYVSCSPFRVPTARLAAAQANIRN